MIEINPARSSISLGLSPEDRQAFPLSSASDGRIAMVTSSVGYLVEALEKQGVSCTAVVAPLSFVVFAVVYNATIVTVKLPSTSGAVDWLIDQQHVGGERPTAKNLALVRAKLDGLTSELGPRVIGLWASPGSGSTHRLLEVQRFCPSGKKTTGSADEEPKSVDAADVGCFVYVSYGMGQKFKFDRSVPQIAIYWRVLLRDLGMRNLGCDKFFQTYSRVSPQDVSDVYLHDLVVHHFVQKKVERKAHHVSVVIDDVRCLLEGSQTLSNGAIPFVISASAALLSRWRTMRVRCHAPWSPHRCRLAFIFHPISPLASRL